MVDRKMHDRIEEIEAYLGSTGRKTFTAYEVLKMVIHIKIGGGWI